MTSNAIQKSLLDNLLHFYDQSLFTDVDIRCANPMGHAKNRFKTVDSFQLMLSSVSPMLRKALEGARGGEGDDGKACIIIADMDADRVESIHRRMMNTDAEGDEEDLDFLVEDCKLFGIDLHEYVAGRRDVKRDEADAKVERTVWKKPVYACIECDKEYTSEISYIKHRKMHLNKRKQQHQEQKVKRENKENEDEDENEDDEEEVEEPENERKTTSGRRVRQPKRFMDLILDTVGGGPIASDDEDVDYVLSSTVVDDDGEGALSSSSNVVVVRPSKRARKTKFVCGECKKNFSSKQALQNHVRLHKNDRKFRCGECGKGFVTAGCLATHNKAHDGSAKTFPCSHCDKLFNNTSNLLRHHRALHFEYSDKRRFACKICYKEFKDPSALSAHARTHEGNREFVCEFCQKSFLTAPHLRVHLVKALLSIYVCNYCFIPNFPFREYTPASVLSSAVAASGASSPTVSSNPTFGTSMRVSRSRGRTCAPTAASLL
jgi:DNA-directed RNA polymerase subunit RPC12/RpoP